MIGGSIVVARSPPAIGPPKAVWKPTWSTPYMIALRHSMLSNGLTVGMIETYQSRAKVGLSDVLLQLGSCRTLRDRGRLSAGALDVHVEVTG